MGRKQPEDKMSVGKEMKAAAVAANWSDWGSYAKLRKKVRARANRRLGRALVEEGLDPAAA